MIQHLLVLFKWKNFLIANFIICTLLATIISFFLPLWYKSSTVLLPPKQPDILSSLSSGASALKGLGSLGKLAGIGQKSTNYNYFAILKSRTVQEAVVRKFDLISEYEIKDSSMEKALKALESNVSFEELEDDNIVIEVYDKDPLRASQMANYFVELLNDVNTRLGTQEARSNREFVESRVSETQRNLRQTEEALREFQEHSGMIITPEQTTSADAVAALYASKAKLEVEVAIMEHSVTADNPAFIQKKLELREFNKKILTIPQIGLKSFRLFRDAAIQQKILEFLIPIYEQARIDEQKNIPVLLVLDKAVPAERKSKPQRVLIVFLASFITLILSVALIFFMEGVQRIDKSLNSIVYNLKKWTAHVISIYRVRG